MQELKKIICINLQGGNLPNYVRGNLLSTSINMFQNKISYSKIDGMTYGGGITTAFRPVSLGGFSGLEFTADLEIGFEGSSRKVLVKYLVEPAILLSGDHDFELAEMSVWEYLMSSLEEYFSTMKRNASTDTIGPTMGCC